MDYCRKEALASGVMFGSIAGIVHCSALMVLLAISILPLRLVRVSDPIVFALLAGWIVFEAKGQGLFDWCMERRGYLENHASSRAIVVVTLICVATVALSVAGLIFGMLKVLPLFLIIPAIIIIDTIFSKQFPVLVKQGFNRVTGR